ncbi:MAG: endonuclease domain-containing protein [Candidatus Accumulibacter phosphatis]|uniref:Endonuclease domain-containing protein n=2 Tax=Pseudomonadota TaxID=1224 RepID=A0ABU6CVJ7_9GAMM|nr:endonuclease domain-containing protein [Candidatus Accumulibacter phosphatis]MEB4590804.1 endonuclease domain-containing protein [Candidatus Thiothrix sp. Deng01]
MTEAENLLWQHLRGHRLNGEKFRRQQAIGPYVVDFVHFGARVVIEADGGQHNESPGDERREAWLKSQGFRILRFWNHEIFNETAAVLEAVLVAVECRHPLSPSPSPARGEGSRRVEGCRRARKIADRPLPPRGGGVGGEGE